MMLRLPKELAAQFAKLSEHQLIGAWDRLILFASEINASDIHIEPQEDALQVRLRVDGVLHSVLSLSLRFSSQILSRLKMLAQLDLAEKRLPQDGRFILNLEFKSIHGRISTCPTVMSEKAVIRLMPTEKTFLKLEDQGASVVQLGAMQKLLDSPHGLVIVTGPTGSGKTMTLYSLLAKLNDSSRNIISIEDPVEMILPGVNQIQVQEKMGLDFKTILRSVLRQDPDVLMIGEIRDFETAEIAIKAAQTGHLVFSTLHTATSYQAISRLEQLGIPRYLILETSKLIVAQRLLRKTCIPSHACLNGFNGRTGIFELLELNPDIQDKILKGQSLQDEDYVEGMTLYRAGMKKVEAGVSTEAEVVRVV